MDLLGDGFPLGEQRFCTGVRGVNLNKKLERWVWVFEYRSADSLPALIASLASGVHLKG